MTDIEMLNAENARLTKLVIELRAEAVRLNAQAVPDAQEKDLLQAIQERDAADDYIDALLDEVLGTDRPEWSSAYGHADAMEQVRETMGSLMKPYVDKAWDRFQSALAAPAAPQPAQADAEPMFWVRLCSDDGYEGPIHDSRIEDVRKQSGAWHPLYLAAPQPAQQPLTDEQIRSIGRQQDPTVIVHHNVLAFARAIEQAHGIGVKND